MRLPGKRVIYDKFAGFLSMQDIGKALQKATEVHESAQLSTGSGNLVRRGKTRIWAFGPKGNTRQFCGDYPQIQNAMLWSRRVWNWIIFSGRTWRRIRRRGIELRISVARNGSAL